MKRATAHDSLEILMQRADEAHRRVQELEAQLRDAKAAWFQANNAFREALWERDGRADGRAEGSEG